MWVLRTHALRGLPLPLTGNLRPAGPLDFPPTHITFVINTSVRIPTLHLYIRSGIGIIAAAAAAPIVARFDFPLLHILPPSAHNSLVIPVT